MSFDNIALPSTPGNVTCVANRQKTFNYLDSGTLKKVRSRNRLSIRSWPLRAVGFRAPAFGARFFRLRFDSQGVARAENRAARAVFSFSGEESEMKCDSIQLLIQPLAGRIFSACSILT